MELCSPSVTESRGSLCRVKQLPCPSAPLSEPGPGLRRLQANGHHPCIHRPLSHTVRLDSPAAATAPPLSSAPTTAPPLTSATAPPLASATAPPLASAPATAPPLTSATAPPLASAPATAPPLSLATAPPLALATAPPLTSATAPPLASAPATAPPLTSATAPPLASAPATAPPLSLATAPPLALATAPPLTSATAPPLASAPATAPPLTSATAPPLASAPTTPPPLASAPATAVRHRPNGVVGSWCSSPECAIARPDDGPVAAAARGGASGAGAGAGKVLVTGGGGYFGFRLGRALASRGVEVILLDLHKPPWDTPAGVLFHQSDIRDYDSLYKVCEGVDCIFHAASYGMSGPEQLKKEQVESVNVGGTNNVINVCVERGIPRLVYTSTVNVVFAGKPIVEGDEESVPCVPLDMHIDHYSRTKAIADQMILSANGRSLRGGGVLWTCVLRPAGIYGPEERRHLHRVMVNVENRLFSFSFGDRQARMNWVHVDNLVTAHVLAAQALTPRKSCVARGQAYFINDGESVNLFEWLTPLFKNLGYSRPLIHLPVSLVYSAAILMEYLHVALRPIVEIPLLFTRNEVRNISVNHTFRIEKARRDLGFRPKRYSLADSVDEYLKSRRPSSRSSLLGVSKDSILVLRLPLALLLLVGLSLAVLLFC